MSKSGQIGIAILVAFGISIFDSIKHGVEKGSITFLIIAVIGFLIVTLTGNTNKD